MRISILLAAACIILIVSQLFASESHTCFKNCRAGDAALQMARHFEGLSLFSYPDVAGHKTIGFGHMLKPNESFDEPITDGEAEEILEHDELITAKGVNSQVTVPLTSNRFDALCDFSFNLGVGRLVGSRLLQAVNSQEDERVPTDFLSWDKARVNGSLRTIRGLFDRRQAEANLYADVN